MIKFKLLKNFYITNHDKDNWVIAKDRVVPANNEQGEPNKNAGEVIRNVSGYYGSLESAWNASIAKMVDTSESKEEIASILAQMKELRTDFLSQLKV